MTDIRVIPVRLNSSGDYSFFSNPTAKFSGLYIGSATVTNPVDRAAILEPIAGLLKEDDTNNIYIAQIPHFVDNTSYFVVASYESAFALSDESKGQWIEPGFLKFGPPPSYAVTRANRATTLWTGSLVAEDLVALLSGVYTIRASRLGMIPSEEAVGALGTVGKNFSSVAKFLDPKIDRNLPRLKLGEAMPTRPEEWKKITRALTTLAIHAEDVSSETTRRRGRPPVKAAQPPAKVAQEGYRPKPA